MFGRMAACGFEHVEETHEVALHVGRRVVDAVPDVGLGAQMDDVRGAEVTPQALKPGQIGKIEVDEPEIVVPRELSQAGLFQLNGVVVAQVVDAHDFAAARLGQTAADMVADEAGGSGDEYFHEGRALQPFKEVVNFRLPPEKCAYYVAWGIYPHTFHL